MFLQALIDDFTSSEKLFREIMTSIFCFFNLNSPWFNHTMLSVLLSFMLLNRLLSRTAIMIIPDCDGDPSVIIDAVLHRCVQHPAAVAPKFSDRVSILKIHVKELIPKVLLLSCNEKEMWWASKSLSLLLSDSLHYVSSNTYHMPPSLTFKRLHNENQSSWWVKQNITRGRDDHLSWI